MKLASGVSAKKGSKQIVLERRTPLMVVVSYGSVDVLKIVLSCPEADVNFSCGNDKSIALHCAASGESSSFELPRVPVAEDPSSDSA